MKTHHLVISVAFCVCLLVFLLDPQFIGIRLPIVIVAALFAFLWAQCTSVRIESKFAIVSIVVLVFSMLTVHTLRHSGATFIMQMFAHPYVTIVYNFGMLFGVGVVTFVAVLALLRLR